MIHQWSPLQDFRSYPIQKGSSSQSLVCSWLAADRTPPAFVRFSVSLLLFLTRSCSVDGVGWGINVMCRVRGTRSCLTRSWCYAQHFFKELLTRSWCYAQHSFLATSHTLLMLRSALLQGTSHTLLMLSSALFPSNFSHALDVTLCTSSENVQHALDVTPCASSRNFSHALDVTLSTLS